MRLYAISLVVFLPDCARPPHPSADALAKTPLETYRGTAISEAHDRRKIAPTLDERVTRHLVRVLVGKALAPLMGSRKARSFGSTAAFLPSSPPMRWCGYRIAESDGTRFTLSAAAAIVALSASAMRTRR